MIIYTLIRFYIFILLELIFPYQFLNIICLQKLIKPTYIIASVFRGQYNLSYCNLNLHKIWNIRKNLVKFKSDSKKALTLWCTTTALRASSQIMAVVNSGLNRLSSAQLRYCYSWLLRTLVTWQLVFTQLNRDKAIFQN